MKRILTFLAATVLLAGCATKPVTGPNLVFIGIDGLGSAYLDTLKMPVIRGLMAEGSYTLHKRSVLIGDDVFAPENEDQVHLRRPRADARQRRETLHGFVIAQRLQFAQEARMGADEAREAGDALGLATRQAARLQCRRVIVGDARGRQSAAAQRFHAGAR